MDDISLSTEIDDFLTLTGMSPTGFGLLCFGDGSFVTELRNGRSPREDNINKARKFMRGHGKSDATEEGEAE